MYDPALGRFTSVDPLAEKYYPLTSYAYCHNSPIFLIDPFGTADGKPNKILWRQVGEGTVDMFSNAATSAMCFYAAVQPGVSQTAGVGFAYMGLMTLGTATMNLAKVVSGFAGEEFPLADTMTGQFGRTVDSKLDNLGVPLENVGDITEELLSITIVPDSEKKYLDVMSRIGVIKTLTDFGTRLISTASAMRPSFERQSKVICNQVDNTAIKKTALDETTDVYIDK